MKIQVKHFLLFDKNKRYISIWLSAIFDNILEAINNSRRTILVLSPRFLDSEWTRYEYQVALQEMLKKKHRIIPLILEDISDIENIDETLKQILDSITYIKWPDNDKKEKHFWKTLQLYRPKKREGSGGSSTQTDVTVTELSDTESPVTEPPVSSDIEDVTVGFRTNSYLHQNIAFSNENENDFCNTNTGKCYQIYHF